MLPGLQGDKSLRKRPLPAMPLANVDELSECGSQSVASMLNRMFQQRMDLKSRPSLLWFTKLQYGTWRRFGSSWDRPLVSHCFKTELLPSAARKIEEAHGDPQASEAKWRMGVVLDSKASIQLSWHVFGGRLKDCRNVVSVWQGVPSAITALGSFHSWLGSRMKFNWLCGCIHFLNYWLLTSMKQIAECFALNVVFPFNWIFYSWGASKETVGW